MRHPSVLLTIPPAKACALGCLDQSAAPPKNAQLVIGPVIVNCAANERILGRRSNLSSQRAGTRSHNDA